MTVYPSRRNTYSEKKIEREGRRMLFRSSCEFRSIDMVTHILSERKMVLATDIPTPNLDSTIYIHVYIYINIHILIYICIYISMYMYIYIFTYIHICIYKHVFFLWSPTNANICSLFSKREATKFSKNV